LLLTNSPLETVPVLGTTLGPAAHPRGGPHRADRWRDRFGTLMRGCANLAVKCGMNGDEPVETCPERVT
jgi:hypothetical protein